MIVVKFFKRHLSDDLRDFKLSCYNTFRSNYKYAFCVLDLRIKKMVTKLQSLTDNLPCTP